MRFPMVQPVTDMTRAALGEWLAPGADEYLDMFHDNAAFEFPFGPGGPVRLDGKPAMAVYLDKIAGSTVFDRFDLKDAYPIGDDGMVLEYRCEARAGASETPFMQDYLCIARTSNGRIDFYREYLAPMNIPGVASKAAATPLDQTSLVGTIVTLDDILKGALCTRVDPAASTFIDMFANDGVLECPFAPAGALHRLRGKDAIADYYKRLTAIQGSDGMVLINAYPAENSDFALLDYEGIVVNKRDGGTYRQRYFAVVRISEGRISLFREYWNPLPLVASFGAAGPIDLDAE